jgi:hypothetical protein
MAVHKLENYLKTYRKRAGISYSFAIQQRFASVNVPAG